MLYLVATPIGNLDDITLRALKTLFFVQAIYCEDTRKTLTLLQHYQNPGQAIPPLFSFFEENEAEKTKEVISKLKANEEVALVTNAGTPTISDPGFKLVRECFRESIKVISIPGPSSVVTALSASGLPTDKFLFLGFLPNKESNRLKLLEATQRSLAELSSTVIFFESPYRLIKSLNDLQKIFGDMEIVIARELTKVYEEIKKEKVSFFIESYTQKSPKGEFVVLFNLKEQPNTGSN